ncbi:hypothetical protein [Dyadobacter beijingensis]|nr:hypothetical protein [Dyadobacter beijingensis]
MPLNESDVTKRLTIFASILIGSINAAIAWPTFFLITAPKQHPKGPFSESTYPPIIDTTIFYLLSSILIFIGLHYHLASEIYLHVFNIVLSIGILCTVLSFLISRSNLAEVFKNRPNNIFLSLITMSLLITASQLLLIYNEHLFIEMSHEQAINSIKENFFKQDILRKALTGVFEMTPGIYLITNFVGLLFASSIFSIIKSPRSFKRRPENHHSISHFYLQGHKFDNALQWLQRTESSSWTDQMWQIMIIAYVGNHKLDTAIMYTQRIVLDRGDTDFINDIRWYFLISWANIYKLDTETISMIFINWIKMCKSDGYLFMAISQFIKSEERHQMASKIKQEQSKNLTTSNFTLSLHLLNIMDGSGSHQVLVGVCKKICSDNTLDLVTRYCAATFIDPFIFISNTSSKDLRIALIGIEKIIRQITKQQDLVFVLANYLGIIASIQNEELKNLSRDIYQRNKIRVTEPHYLQYLVFEKVAMS